MLCCVGGEASHVQVASPLGNFESVGLYLDGLFTLLFVYGRVDINWRVGAGQDFSVHLLASLLSASGTGLSVFSIFTAVANEVDVALFRSFDANRGYFAERTEKTEDTFLRVVRLGEIFYENGVEDFSDFVFLLGIVLGRGELLLLKSFLN